MSNTPEIKLQLQDWRGYSAYEVAVQNGFTGSQKEWLESLVGGALMITVNGRNVDENGNITVYASDIKMQENGLFTIPERFDQMDEQKMDKSAVVNNLETNDPKNPLSAAAGVELKKAVLAKADLMMATITIPADGWEGDRPYTRDIVVEGMKTEYGALLTDYPDGGANEETFAECETKLTGRGENKITVRVTDLPRTSYKANLLVLDAGVSEDE